MSLPTQPAPLVPASIARLPYTAPRLTPLGEWTRLTLVTSLPIGPGSSIFNPASDRPTV